jgi:hypothetical protein
MPSFSNIDHLLKRFGLNPIVPRPDRWPVSRISAFYGADAPTTPAFIRNIGSGGIYLETEEPLAEGQLLSLKLQLEGDPNLVSDLRITIKATVVRKDEFGVGIMFVPLPGLNPDLWEVLVRGTVVLTDPGHVIPIFRTLRTVLFLSRICPSGAEEAIALLHGNLEQNRSETLFKIAFGAENSLAADPDYERMRAHPELVTTILREGSWAADELTTNLWKGLLISSCSLDQADDSNRIFAQILIHITPRQAAIFTHACERVLNTMPAPSTLNSASVVLSPEEIVQVAGMHDLTRIATDLAYLFNLGLIQNVFDFTSYSDFDRFDITPTQLGLELYSRCRGQRGKIDPEHIAAASKLLTTLLPQPTPGTQEILIPYASKSPRES